jgi:hypothetical protein
MQTLVSDRYIYIYTYIYIYIYRFRGPLVLDVIVHRATHRRQPQTGRERERGSVSGREKRTQRREAAREESGRQ